MGALCVFTTPAYPNTYTAWGDYPPEYTNRIRYYRAAGLDKYGNANANAYTFPNRYTGSDVSSNQYTFTHEYVCTTRYTNIGGSTYADGSASTNSNYRSLSFDRLLTTDPIIDHNLGVV